MLFEPSCYSFSDGSIDFTGGSTSSPLTYLWSTNDTTEDLNNIPTGIYEVIITDTFNCSNTFQYSLGQPDSIQIDYLSSFYNGYNVSCFGASDGFLDITPSGATPPYQFNWSVGATSEDLLNVASTTYFLTLTDNNGCLFYDSFYLNEPSEMASTLLSTSNYNGYDISCYNFNDGSVELFVSGSVPPYSYNWSNGGNQSSLDSLFYGPHAVEVIDANGCTHWDTIILTQPTPISSTIISVNDYNGYDISCFEFNDGEIDVNVSGGVDPYVYLWNNGAGVEDIDNLGAGNYSVNIVDQNSCYVDLQIVLTEPPPLVLNYQVSNYNGYNISCHSFSDGWVDVDIGGSVPPYTYSWSNATSLQDLTGVSQGQYALVVQDINLCEIDLEVVLNEPSPLDLDLSAITNYNGYNISCFGYNDGSVLAQVEGSLPPYNLVWNNNPSLQDNVLDNVFAGSHFLNVSDQNNCQIVDTIILLQPDELLSSIASTNDYSGYDISCHSYNDGGIDLSLNGGVSPYTYSWNNGNTWQDLSDLTEGTYDVFISDLNNCTTSNQITLVEPLPLEYSVTTSDYNGYQISCHNYSDGWVDLIVNGSVPPYLFAWSNGTNQEDLMNVASGIYTVSIFDENNCSTNVSVSLSQPNPLVSSLSSLTNFNGYDISCYGFNDGAISASISGSVPPYSLLWNTGDQFEPLTALYADNYVLSVVDENNCQIVDSILLSQPNPLSSNISSAFDYNGYDISCYNYSDGGVDLSVFGGVSPYNFMWNTNESLEDLSNLSAGTYDVSISDNNGCQIANNIILNHPTPLTLSLSSSDYNGFNVSCFGFNDGFINSFVNGSAPPYSFGWSNGSSAQNINELGAGNYSLVVTDQNNCTIADDVQMTEPNDFFVTLDFSSDTCSKGVAYGAVSVTPEFNPYSYLWANGEISSSINNLYAGPNSVLVSDIYNCSKLLEFNVDNLPNPFADFSIEPTNDSLFFKLGTSLSFIDQSTDSWSYIDSWIWDFNDGHTDSLNIVFHEYKDIGIYDVLLMVENVHGCIDTTSRRVEISNFIIHIPNCFTPQGDNLNERFISKGIGIKEYLLNIYSRWGELIYSTNDMEYGWDGTYQSTGVQCPQGVYVYDVQIVDDFGDIHRFVGDVTLVD